jgi:hypothetical protein
MAGYVVFNATRQGPVIAKETWDALQQDIDLAEAEKIIGMPPGDYTTRKLRINLKPAGAHQKRWATDAGIHELIFDFDGKMVQRVHYTEPKETWPQRLRRWFGV